MGIEELDLQRQQIQEEIRLIKEKKLTNIKELSEHLTVVSSGQNAGQNTQILPNMTTPLPTNNNNSTSFSKEYQQDPKTHAEQLINSIDQAFQTPPDLQAQKRNLQSTMIQNQNNSSLAGLSISQTENYQTESIIDITGVNKDTNKSNTKTYEDDFITATENSEPILDTSVRAENLINNATDILKDISKELRNLDL